MKNFFKKAIFFLLYFTVFTVILNTAFLGFIVKTDWDFIKRLETLRFDNPNFELLVLGSSLGQYGIDTEFLTKKGIKSFNLSMVGSSVKTNFIQLEEYLSNYATKPDYVILSVNSNLEAFHQEGIQPVVEFTMKDHKYGIKDVPISKFNWAGMELIKKAFRPEYRQTYVSYGHKKSKRIEPDITEFNESHINFDKFESAIWMGEIAKLCDQHEIEFIVVEIPGERETQNLSEIGPHLLHFGNGYSAKLYNLNNQDFCKFIDINKDWSGMSHFNIRGAEKFTQELIDYDLFLHTR